MPVLAAASPLLMNDTSSEPVVSVIMPVWSPDRSFFEASVRSVLDQHEDDLELIIVEDPADIDGESIVAGMNDERIRYVKNRSRTSLSRQHNQALELARGGLIARFDADDVMHPEKLSRQIEFMRENPSLDIVGTALLIIDSESHVIGVREYPLHHDAIIEAFRRYNPIANPSVMFRRRVFETIGGWSESAYVAGQDYEWFSRAAHAGMRFANLPVPLVQYRLHGSSLKSKRLEGTIRATIEVKKKYWWNEMSATDRLMLRAERLLLFLPTRFVMALFRRLRYRPVDSKSRGPEPPDEMNHR